MNDLPCLKIKKLSKTLTSSIWGVLDFLLPKHLLIDHPLVCDSITEKDIDVKSDSFDELFVERPLVHISN